MATETIQNDLLKQLLSLYGQNTTIVERISGYNSYYEVPRKILDKSDEIDNTFYTILQQLDVILKEKK